MAAIGRAQNIKCWSADICRECQQPGGCQTQCWDHPGPGQRGGQVSCGWWSQWVNAHLWLVESWLLTSDWSQLRGGGHQQPHLLWPGHAAAGRRGHSRDQRAQADQHRAAGRPAGLTPAYGGYFIFMFSNEIYLDIQTFEPPIFAMRWLKPAYNNLRMAQCEYDIWFLFPVNLCVLIRRQQQQL